MQSEDLFDLRQGTIKPLKGYLNCFNKVIVLVGDPNKRFFVKAFMKGLKNRGFSEALSIWKPQTMDEVTARADKHIEEETAASKDERATKASRRQYSPVETSAHAEILNHFSGKHDRGGRSRNRKSHPNPEAAYTPL